jgi:basic membrane lipoprotein Med (substrate-binding protein (PBP1-ABC) superfamily)
MLVRMTPPIRTRIAQFAAIALALFAGSAVAAALASTPASDGTQRALVIAGPAAEHPGAAKALAAEAHAEVRVVHATADQLGVAHMLAARGYDTVMTVGVDREHAIAPVARKYPETRFVEVSLR